MAVSNEILEERTDVLTKETDNLRKNGHDMRNTLINIGNVLENINKELEKISDMTELRCSRIDASMEKLSSRVTDIELKKRDAEIATNLKKKYFNETFFIWPKTILHIIIVVGVIYSVAVTHSLHGVLKLAE